MDLLERQPDEDGVCPGYRRQWQLDAAQETPFDVSQHVKHLVKDLTGRGGGQGKIQVHTATPMLFFSSNPPSFPPSKFPSVSPLAGWLTLILSELLRGTSVNLRVLRGSRGLRLAESTGRPWTCPATDTSTYARGSVLEALALTCGGEGSGVGGRGGEVGIKNQL